MDIDLMPIHQWPPHGTVRYQCLPTPGLPIGLDVKFQFNSTSSLGFDVRRQCSVKKAALAFGSGLRLVAEVEVGAQFHRYSKGIVQYIKLVRF